MDDIKRLSVVFLVVLTVFYCTAKGQQKEKIDFNVKRTDKELRYSQFVNSISYIKLDNNAFITRIKTIKYVNDNFYVHDDKAQSIFIFDKWGKFLSQIKRFGRGPEEYKSITTFDINRVKNEIHILDLSGNKIIVYSNKGDFVRTVKLNNNDLPRDFISLDNENYLFYSNDNPKKSKRRVWKTDKTGKFLKQLIKSENRQFSHHYYLPRYLVRIGQTDQIGLISDIDKTWYHIQKGKVISSNFLDLNVNVSEDILMKRTVKCNNR
ncbi:MAG: 6-bladed beta-propeller [Cytophagales bacterium]|nr:6-bladed beta-propeller [Cytophagales bacterium]